MLYTALQRTAETRAISSPMRPGQIIRALRLEQGVSIKDLAARMQAAGDNLDRTQLSRIEIGQRTLTADRAAMIARALGVSPDAFYDGTA